MVHEKHCRNTLTACELDVGDELRFALLDGRVVSIRIQSTRARLHRTDLAEPDRRPLEPARSARTVIRMHCTLSVDGHHVELVRWVGSDRSFYEPWTIMGVRIWLDAVDDLFALLSETHGDCRPRKAVRLAVQDARLRICPPLLHPWCPLPADGLRMEHAYDGADCWLGPYYGAEAHGGLDINHRAGTPIWAPIPLVAEGLFNSLDAGDDNNRWRGTFTWPDGSRWILQVHHVIRALVPDGAIVPSGTQVAEGAGVHVGSHEHSHFVFAVQEPGSTFEDRILLDPWILFRRMYRDRELTTA